MVIVPYTSIGPLVFGVTSAAECLELLGTPDMKTTNWQGVEQYCYKHVWIRIDPHTRRVSDCSLIPFAEASVDGIPVTWDMDFLRRVCACDGEPMLAYGFVVLKKLGIAITGIHDDDRSQLAVTAFLRDQLDGMLTDAVPFHIIPVE